MTSWRYVSFEPVLRGRSRLLFLLDDKHRRWVTVNEQPPTEATIAKVGALVAAGGALPAIPRGVD